MATDKWQGVGDSRPSSSTSPKAQQGIRQPADIDWMGQKDSRPSSSTTSGNPVVKTGGK